MVRNGEEVRGGVARMEDVRCQVSGVRCQVSGVTGHKGNHVLNSARNTVLVTSHVSKSKMLLLRKVILQRFTLKVKASARRD
jgi:hypothetical protein